MNIHFAIKTCQSPLTRGVDEWKSGFRFATGAGEIRMSDQTGNGICWLAEGGTMETINEELY
jgi:hypothetical protein